MAPPPLSRKTNRYKPTLLTLRADFLDLRCAPPGGASGAAPLARSARQGREVQCRSQKSARSAKSFSLCPFFFFRARPMAPPPRRRPAGHPKTSGRSTWVRKEG
eukprot:7822221-Pyramimonas_sp.AAC.1